MKSYISANFLLGCWGLCDWHSNYW